MAHFILGLPIFSLLFELLFEAFDVGRKLGEVIELIPENAVSHHIAVFVCLLPILLPPHSLVLYL